MNYLTQLKLYGRRKGEAWLARLAQRIVEAARPHAARLVHKLDARRPYRLEIGHPDRVVVLLAGCGGSGSFAAHILAQLTAWAGGAGLDMRLYFVDPDHVEEKNLVRQNFCRAELGGPKALTLAWRYTAAFGVHITLVVDHFRAGLLDRYRPLHSTTGTLTLVVGAVDNVCARRDIAAAIEERLPRLPPGDSLFWLDAGNERTSGQVLIGNSLEPEPLLSPLGYCLALPLPHIQEPSLLRDRPRPAADARLSCAELTALAEQSAMVNRLMATWLGLYAYRLLQSRDLSLMASFLDGQTGSVRSVPITDGRTVLPPRPRPQPVEPVEPT